MVNCLFVTQKVKLIDNSEGEIVEKNKNLKWNLSNDLSNGHSIIFETWVDNDWECRKAHSSHSSPTPHPREKRVVLMCMKLICHFHVIDRNMTKRRKRGGCGRRQNYGFLEDFFPLAVSGPCTSNDHALFIICTRNNNQFVAFWGLLINTRQTMLLAFLLLWQVK